MHPFYISFVNLRETSPDNKKLDANFGASDTCARCLMPVYEMEKVSSVKKVYKKFIYFYIISSLCCIFSKFGN